MTKMLAGVSVPLPGIIQQLFVIGRWDMLEHE